MTVRDLEARLKGQVEDKVLGRLGYRETSVMTPKGIVIEPRPQVLELDSQAATRALGGQLLMDLSGSDRPITTYQVTIPRTYPASDIRVEGVWVLDTDGEGTLECRLVEVTRKDAYWVLLLVPQRRDIGTNIYM